MTRTHNCDPTMTDSQVLEFCKNGFLMFKGVVPAEINRETLAYLNERDTAAEPTSILDEDWFVENVICNSTAAGAVRSLLGANFHLPILMSNHRLQGPKQAQSWHVDGNFKFGPQVNYLQVFYLPQDTPPSMGPTMVVPGTHLVKNATRAMKHYGRIRGQVLTDAPAGSIFITAYQIWHRRTTSTAPHLRHMLKYCYWRTAEPKRDWLIDPDFTFDDCDYTSPADALGDQFRVCMKVAEMFCWLCGHHEHFQILGGQSWPLPSNRNATSYGFPAALGA